MVNGYLFGSRRYRRPIVTHVYTNPGTVFDGHAYAKGGAVLHSLRLLMGEDAFWRGMHDYVQKYRFQNVDTHDFMRAMEEASGQSLGEFFQQWLYSPGHPEFQVSWSWDEAGQMAKLQARQTQKTDDGTPIFHAPLKLLSEGPWGREEHEADVKEAVTEYQFKLPGRPLMVLFDSRHAVLKSLEFTKSTEEWIYQSEHGPDASHRIDAIDALEKVAAEEGARQALAGVLKMDPVIKVRTAAAGALGDSQRREAAPALVEALSAADARVRAAALDGLQSLPAAVMPGPVVRRLAEADPSISVRSAALRLLAKHDPKGARPLLVQALAVPSLRDSLRVTALELLAEEDDAPARTALLAWAQGGGTAVQRVARVPTAGVGRSIW